VSQPENLTLRFLTLLGLDKAKTGHIQNFVQSSAVGTGGRTTLNLGLGRRYLSADEQFIYGINTFFDIDPRYNHQRASVGFEVKGNALELTANSYHGLSDWKTGKDGNTERALGGHDIELGAQGSLHPCSKNLF
jgi:adhesin/invasin